MKKNLLLIPAVAALLLSVPAAFSGGGWNDVQSIEHKDKHISNPVRPQPGFVWDTAVQPRYKVLHPSSPKGAGMRAASLNEIDQIMDKAISDQIMPGAVVLVARGGKVVKHSAYGFSARYADDSFSELENLIPMNTYTIFDLASISKIFTSVAVMILHEKGLIELDQHAAVYIPEFAQAGKESVTVRQLLTHTSGLEAWIPLYSKGHSREERLQLVFKQPLKNEPGTVYTYSDLNMITLGAIVEKLTAQPLDEFVKEYITGPLGMKDTMYNPPLALQKRIAATEYQPLLKRGLVWGQVHDENAWSLDGVAGHAGVFSTASDLAKFASIFLNEGKYAGKRILSPESVHALLENQNTTFPGDDHGLGWELNQGWYMDAMSDGDSFGHTGYTGTSIVVNPSNKTIAILLTNRVHPSRSTVSVNQTRRLFARRVADSIPVTIPGKGNTWFSGYGDNQNKVLETDLSLRETGIFSFKQWHRMEGNADFGFVEVYRDGAWQQLAKFTANSQDWEKTELILPKEASKLRFRYQTDGSVNGRGWYIYNPEVKTEGKTSELPLTSSDWLQRNY
ncbi:serine hydrolase domain-containing protein [Mesobacillus foraminis]|uniref:CubicO group peptidase (Beta-lactamase class C family) n=1 Tax=Mesobacillus foraminis TaxID=279826 RepID=A0A4R2BJ40_9BACI|nr:serine hydrolase domain-containing protein [Mesobacillus foraminis]TCN26089.1 CubicO group peptidase (beta-lactamase class C family) [Mesobacillus foraminis]